MNDAIISKCPFTGLNITTHPEWENITISKEHSVSYRIIENNILLGEAIGTTNLESIKKSLNIALKIINENFDDKPFVYIENFSKFTSSTTSSRKYYIKFMKSLKKMKGLIYYNVNPILSLSVKLGQKLNFFGFDIHVTKNYAEAIEFALKTLNIKKDFELIDNKKKITPNNSTWDIQFDDYSVRHEIINKNTLHILSEGNLDIKHTDEVFGYLENFIEENFSKMKGKYYYLVDLSKATLSRKCRKLYAKKIQAIYNEYPFKFYVYYGSNRLMDVLAVFLSPFFSFKLKKANDLNDALDFIKKDTASIKHDKNKQNTSTETQSYIDEFKDKHIEDFIFLGFCG